MKWNSAYQWSVWREPSRPRYIGHIVPRMSGLKISPSFIYSYYHSISILSNVSSILFSIFTLSNFSPLIVRIRRGFYFTSIRSHIVHKAILVICTVIRVELLKTPSQHLVNCQSLILTKLPSKSPQFIIDLFLFLWYFLYTLLDY